MAMKCIAHSAPIVDQNRNVRSFSRGFCHRMPILLIGAVEGHSITHDLRAFLAPCQIPALARCEVWLLSFRSGLRLAV